MGLYLRPEGRARSQAVVYALRDYAKGGNCRAPSLYPFASGGLTREGNGSPAILCLRAAFGPGGDHVKSTVWISLLRKVRSWQPRQGMESSLPHRPRVFGRIIAGAPF